MLNLEGIDHIALSVKDVRRSVEWYQKTLGLQRHYEETWGDFPAVIGLGSTSLALFPAGEDAAGSTFERSLIGMRHIAFRAGRSAFEDAQTQLTSEGLEFQFEDHEIAHSIYFQDPDGYVIEITTYELGSD